MTFFNLGTHTSFVRAPGEANDNYFVETAGNGFVVKVIKEKSLENLQLELPFIERMMENDFPIAPYVKSPSGVCIYQDDEIMAVVMEQIEGKTPSISKSTIYQYGVTLAELHKISIKNLPDRHSWFDRKYISNALKNAELKYGSKATKIYYEVYHSLSYLYDTPFQQSIVHGDFNQDNSIFYGGKLVAVLDWEEVCVAPAIFDFGFTIICCCYPNDNFDANLYESLLKGYLSVGRISAEEMSFLGDVVRLMGLLASVWNLVHYGPVDLKSTDENWTRGYWTICLNQWKPPIF